MALIDNLVADIVDPALRTRFEAAVTQLRMREAFGLRFERHIPEWMGVPGARIRVGSLVGELGSNHGRPLKVERLAGDTATCRGDGDEEARELPLRTLTLLKRTGEPVYPALRLVEDCPNAGHGRRHVLIEGDNLGALQLLHWTHNRNFDCIYIDPPYNTGARDWKYNNNYVDENDAFRSSKWLSMMERRLRIAKGLLKTDGVLIIAIDDYELANLLLLLDSDRMFRGWSIETVAVQNNPRGGGGSHISNTHEYAVFVVPPGTKLTPISRGLDEKRDFRRRGRGDRNLRSGRPNSFYAIHVDREEGRVVGVGPSLGRDEAYEKGPTPEGYQRIYPLGRNELERVWRNSRDSLAEKLASGEIDLRCTARGTIVQIIAGEGKNVPIKSIWVGARYNAGEQGSNLVTALTGEEFDYPKSLYTVFDCIRAVVGDRPEAQVLDYFGGSGTTTHAVMLLNAIDGGQRQSVLVTNNEVGDRQEAIFRARNLTPADDEWQAAGICRSITFPRCRNAILGTGATDDPVQWEYQTDQFTDEERTVDVRTLPFLDPKRAADAQIRSSIAPLIGITQTALRRAESFYISPAEGCRDPEKGQAVLFDPDALEAFLEEISDAGDHVHRVWLATSGNAKRDKQIANAVADAAGLRFVPAAVPRAASIGFEENLAYFRLEYLDPGAVEVGRHLDDLLPTLWLMAGANGSVPTDTDNADFFFPVGSQAALLIRQRGVRQFLQEVHSRPELRWAFIITDSSEAFQETSALLPNHIPPSHRVQLYRDYLANFSINMGEQ